MGGRLKHDTRGAGLAPRMMRAAGRWARHRGIRVLEALTLPENGAMRGLGRKIGARSWLEDGMIRQRFDIDRLLRDEPEGRHEPGQSPIGLVAHVAAVSMHRPADRPSLAA